MNFRKHIGITLAFLILAANMGFAINVHYCHDEVASVSIAYKLEESCTHHAEEKKACCAAGAEDDHKHCCKDDFVKLQDDKADNIIVKSLQLDLGTFCHAGDWKPVPSYSEVPLLAQQNASFYCEAHAPPLFKLYCQYIFYA